MRKKNRTTITRQKRKMKRDQRKERYQQIRQIPKRLNLKRLIGSSMICSG